MSVISKSAEVRVFAALLFALCGANAAADCRCPDAARSRNLLMTVETDAHAGLVACGYEDERRPDSVVASEFQIFRCGHPEPLLEFDALQTAALRNTGAALQVTELERWPFGKEWQWVQVPVYEWLLSPHDPRPEFPRIFPPAPAVTRREIEAFIREYKQWISIPGNERSYDLAEQFVARLFTSAVAGEDEADALFLTMRDDVELDGAAAEIYGQARATYDVWREARRRLPKH
jgi:hypothetical protein